MIYAPRKPSADSATSRGQRSSRQHLLKIYAAYRHVPVSDLARVVAGSEWAAIMFEPSAKGGEPMSWMLYD
jgi:hypothetical protein